jgi:hypothetical protein
LLEDETKTKWEKTLEDHEKTYPQPIIRKIDGNLIGDSYKPQAHNVDEAGEE